jgi:hypothetical protein
VVVLIRDYLPYVISLLTIYITILQGNKHPKVWLLCTGSQFLWLIWIVVDHAWGMLPLNVFMWFICYRNHFKWQKG